MIKKLQLFVLSLLMSTINNAQNDDGHKHLALSNTIFEIDRSTDISSSIAKWPVFQNKKYGLVSLSLYPTLSQQSELEELGVEFLGFYPKDFYLISIDVGAEKSLLDPFGLEAVTAYLPEFKGSLQTEEASSWAIAKNERVTVNVHPFKNIKLPSLTAELSKAGFIVEGSDKTNHFVTVELSQTEIDELVALPAVQFLDWKYAEGFPENYSGRTLHRTSFISPENNNGLNYTGEGVSVMLQDDGAIGPHIDHHGRAVQFWPTSQGDHGDHVGGTIAGAGNLNPMHQGQAPGASLYVYKAWPEYSAYDSVSSHYNSLNTFLTSTSYSDGCNAGYTARTRTMDEQVYDYASLMHVFSAGNSGTSNCGYGAGSVWGNITGGHKMGKNVITVANLNEQDAIATSSSRGPAHDGRIKPDISAKGTSVTSTISGNQYDTYNGTSMSCPGITGSLAVLYEAFEDITGSSPDGGLMKAIVLNTAEDLGNAGPDFIYGWGRINARKAFEVINQGSYQTSSVGQSQEETFNLTVPSSQSRARFMVYWTDPAAQINATTALINDLDLKVIDPNGDTLLPYVLNSAPNPTTLDEPAAYGEDHLNNVEQVELVNPQSGTYQVIVNGALVPMGPQSFYLVHWFEPNELEITHPVGGETIIPQSTQLIRWDAGDTSETIQVEYTLDGGANWTLLSSAILPDQGFIYWPVPFATTSKAQVRLTQGSTVVYSDYFSVMPVPENLNVAWVCPDSLAVTWSPVTNATEYNVYRLGQKYMDSIGSSLTIDFVDYNVSPLNPNVWYSVSSVGPNGARSERAIAINKPVGVFNCFLNSDLEMVTLLPESSTMFDCFGDETVLGFVAKNNGVNPIMGFDATLVGPVGSIITETFTSNIAPGQSDTFYFDSTVSFSTNLEEYEAIVDYSSDQNSWNDTVRRSFKAAEGMPVAPIWREDFDTYSPCSSIDNCGETSCLLPNGWVNEENGKTDDIDWRVFFGSTPSNQTGPSGDNTQNVAVGRYIYLEASGNCTEQTAELLSPCIDLTQANEAKLTFYYHMYGAEMGELHVDVYDGNSWVQDVITPLTGNFGNQWLLKEVDLSDFSGKLINVRFRGVTGAGFTSDIALDDISILHMPVANFSFTTQPNEQPVLFTDLSAYGNQMSFDLDDGTVLTSVPASHQYSNTANYTVTQIVTNEIGADTFSLDINNLGVDDISGHDLKVFPNPAINEVFVSWNGEVKTVSLFSGDGRLLATYPVSGKTSLVLNTSQLAAGIYNIQLSGEQSENKVLVVH
ncbi:MAG: S8 family serine peptidase [Salibacteraceae bacterium]